MFPGTQMYWLQHKLIPDATHLASKTPFSLPASITGAVDFVGGLRSEFIDLPSPEFVARRRKAYARHMQRWRQGLTSGGSQACFEQNASPPCIKTAYNITVANLNSSNSQATLEAGGQSFSPADLKSFQKQWKLPVQAVVNVTGPNDPGSPGDEASLDIQFSRFDSLLSLVFFCVFVCSVCQL